MRMETVSETALQRWLLAALVPVLLILAISAADDMQDHVRYDLVPVSDLGRDLVGVSAIQADGGPYQRLGEIQPGRFDEAWANQWVAHSPLSIATARAASLDGLLDERLVDTGARLVQITALVALGLAVWIGLGVAVHVRLLLVGALVLGSAALSDVRWVQGNTLLALGLLGVLTADRAGRRAWALGLLSLLVAWKPWVFPLSLLLPNGRNGYFDGAAVALGAASITLLSLPFAGGPVLDDWLFNALPANVSHIRESVLQMGASTFFPDLLAQAVYMSAVASLPLFRRWIRPELWPALGSIVILGLGLIVWDHYIIGLAPALLWPLLTSRSVDGLLPYYVVGFGVLLLPAAAGWAVSADTRLFWSLAAGQAFLAAIVWGLVMAVAKPRERRPVG